MAGRNAVALALFVVACLPASAGEVFLTGSFTQGGLVWGQAPGAVAVNLDGREVPLAPAGAFLFGLGPDAVVVAVLEVVFADGSRKVRTLDVSGRNWAVERIEGLPAAMVTPPPEVLARIRSENAAIGAVRRLNTPQSWVWEGFRWPLTGRITGVFGSRRVLNGEQRRPHYGVDIAAPTGTPVVAAAPGMVALAEPDLYYTGGTIMVDHGYGITSVYSHLSAVNVGVGDFVDAGEEIGHVGATGRVTGAHLDWRVNWFEVRLDPALLVPPMP